MSHEVSITGFEFNMAGWMAEKACSSALDGARMIDLLRDMTPAPLEATWKLKAHLSQALYGITKLWAAGCGADWDHRDRDEIADHGLEGFKRLHRKYHRFDWAPFSPPAHCKEIIEDAKT